MERRQGDAHCGNVTGDCLFLLCSKWNTLPKLLANHPEIGGTLRPAAVGSADSPKAIQQVVGDTQCTMDSDAEYVLQEMESTSTASIDQLTSNTKGTMDSEPEHTVQGMDSTHASAGGATLWARDSSTAVQRAARNAEGVMNSDPEHILGMKSTSNQGTSATLKRQMTANESR